MTYQARPDVRVGEAVGAGNRTGGDVSRLSDPPRTGSGPIAILHPISNEVHQHGHYMARLRGVSMAGGGPFRPTSNGLPAPAKPSP